MLMFLAHVVSNTLYNIYKIDTKNPSTAYAIKYQLIT